MSNNSLKALSMLSLTLVFYLKRAGSSIKHFRILTKISFILILKKSILSEVVIQEGICPPVYTFIFLYQSRMEVILFWK